MSLSKEQVIEHYLEKFPEEKSSARLAQLLKWHEASVFVDDNLKDLAKLVTSVKNPQTLDTSYFSIVAGCQHIPFHDKEQFETMSILGSWLSQRHTTKLVLAGDILDMNSISRHNRGNASKVKGLTLGEEYRIANEAIDLLDYGYYSEKYFMYGNHEAWYYAHMAQIDNAKLGEDVIKSPAEGLHLEERGYKVLSNYGQDFLMLGNLLVTHGNYVNKHASMAHLEAYKQNVLFFHTHRMGSFIDSGPNNSQIAGYNGGFGGDRTQVAFNYMPEDMKRKWQNGFAVTYTDNQGETYVDLLQWKNKKFIYMGHEFTSEGVKPLLK
jgi:hypothetical protein